jgi:hypothetical protein
VTAAIDAHPLVQYASAASAEVPAALDMVLDVLRQKSEATIAGSGPASLPKATPPPPVLTVVPGPQTMGVFAIRHLAYTDAVGKLHCLPKFTDVELPVALAEKAIKLGGAAPFTDPRRKQKGAFGVLVPPLQHCLVLDDTAAPGQLVVNPSGVPTHSAFEPMPGLKAPYSVRVPRPPAAQPLAAATRKAEDGEHE